MLTREKISIHKKNNGIFFSLFQGALALGPVLKPFLYPELSDPEHGIHNDPPVASDRFGANGSVRWSKEHQIHDDLQRSQWSLCSYYPRRSSIEQWSFGHPLSVSTVLWSRPWDAQRIVGCDCDRFYATIRDQWSVKKKWPDRIFKILEMLRIYRWPLASNCSLLQALYSFTICIIGIVPNIFIGTLNHL